MSKKIMSAMNIARRMAGGRVGYADGGAPGPDLRRQRQNAAMAGRELTPEQEAAVQEYLANMDARRELVGQQWDKSTEGMFTPSPALPQMDPKTQREIANRSLAGRDLNYGQMQALADNAGAKEARSENLGTLGAMGAEITGVPAMLRGAGNMARGVEEGDPIRGASGALEAGLGAVPMLSVGRGAVSGLANAAMSTPMRRAGLFGLAGGLTGYSDEAAAQQRNVAKFVQEHPEVRAILEKRTEAMSALQAAEQDLITKNQAVAALEAKKRVAEELLRKENVKHRGSPPETQKQALEPFKNEIKSIEGQIGEVRNRALKPYTDEIDRLAKGLTKAEEVARDQFMEQGSFREKNPGATAAILGTGMGLAAGWPMVKGVGERVMDAKSRKPAIEAAMRIAKQKLEGPAPIADAAAAQTVLRNKIGRWDQEHGALHGTANAISAGGKGAVFGAEASSLPEQIDYNTNEPGHPARERAAELFAKPSYWQERLAPAGLGAALGVTGAGIPKLLPKNYGFLDEAREVASRGQAPSAMQQLMSRFRESKPLGPTEAAMADVERYRNAAGLRPSAAPEPLSPTSTASGSAQPASTTPLGPSAAAAPTALPGSSFAPHPAMGPAHAIEDAMPAFGRGTAPSPSPAAAAPASSPASDTPAKIIYRQKDKRGRVIHKDDETGYFAPNPKKKKDSPAVDEKKYGGVVASAMRIARAMGGRIHTGPILQRADGGRTDTVPMDVASGSYVIPADIISALGEGDTGAGMKAIDGMFGPHAEGGAKDAVPIIAAGGEYVLSPSQVARIAGGDLSKAHAMLDQWVKATRAKHIETLANLPGPER